ncbi:magnesium-translocating P-type ATPase [soil metagenome]
MASPVSNSSTFFWSKEVGQQLQDLKSSAAGLSNGEAVIRKKEYGLNELGSSSQASMMLLLIRQFKSPITLLLIGAAILSYFLHDPIDAIIIMTIVLISSGLGFWQEKGAGDAVKKLLSIVQIKTNALRDGVWIEIPLIEIVPGDIVKLSAGDAVPADCLIVESNELFTDEAAFTGETFPVEKRSGPVEAQMPMSKRINTLFMGSHVTSGTATALVVQTGLFTEFGRIAKRLKSQHPETDFERGIRKLGYLLIEITGTLVVLILFFNMLLHRPVLDSFLFALALAVGLTPQLLPAIISINLAKGAQQMAKKKVIVKRLSSIESFGSMNVLCSDKTGTLTEGKVKLHQATDFAGKDSGRVLFLAAINSALQQGYKNPIDQAIVELAPKESLLINRLDETPYDFIRKRLVILADLPEGNTMIVKGAFNEVLGICTQLQTDEDKVAPLESFRASLIKQYQDFSEFGFRTLAVATKPAYGVTNISKEDENNLTFRGFITLFDPVKPDARDTITQLNGLGVQLKIITGDNEHIAHYMAGQLGFDHPEVLTGKEIRLMSTDALIHRAPNTHVFAEVEPNQKERIILALKKSGNVVGYMGDGINDATALHAADVGISVDSAVDVAKEAADIILLDKNLSVIIDGIKEGRKVFLNTLKYIFMATSANFGNMFSMAGASLLLPFLPLLPKQILITNLLTDFPEMTIATDRVDEQATLVPRKWNMAFITKYMIVFGLLSSVFDYMTFGILIYFLKANQQQFQTGWFMESVVSATLIVLVLRTQRPMLKSRPGNYLFTTTVLVAIFTLILPYFPFAGLLGFTPLPLRFYGVMLSIVILYIISAEIVKRQFYKYVLLP